jgi:CheY-like chemotaxis protein
MKAESKVLVVDDDATIRSTLIEAVRTWGYRTVEAATLSGTLTMVESERPDAVLLDVKLPDGSGISVLDELRKAIAGVGDHHDHWIWHSRRRLHSRRPTRVWVRNEADRSS